MRVLRHRSIYEPKEKGVEAADRGPGGKRALGNTDDHQRHHQERKCDDKRDWQANALRLIGSRPAVVRDKQDGRDEQARLNDARGINAPADQPPGKGEAGGGYRSGGQQPQERSATVSHGDQPAWSGLRRWKSVNTADVEYTANGTEEGSGYGRSGGKAQAAGQRVP